MNSPPYGYGGLNADIIVLPVRIIMSPTCSSKFLVGRKALSATARTTVLAQYHQHSCGTNMSRKRCVDGVLLVCMSLATHFPLDRASGVPLGVQLADRLKRAIRGGELSAGDQLPSVRQMAALAGVNVNTVRTV